MKKSSKAPSVEQIINHALAIEMEPAQDAGALGFMARAMVQATLPHKKVAGNEFERTNGNYTLNLLAPSKIGLPYGSIPRLLLAWLTTEAVKTQSRELELGDSLSGFMRELGMVPTGGRWGSITRLKDQTLRLFSCTVTATYDDAKKHAGMGYRLADKTVLWWDAPKNQSTQWQSTVKLSETFFEEIVAHPIPVDMRALNALKKSPLALDIYCWMTYRASYAKRSSVIPWSMLAQQFGSDYKLVRQFKAAFLEEIRKVFTVYAGVQVEATDEGLLVKPSLTHVRRRDT
jgi:Plasmid encoded RepA protein